MMTALDGFMIFAIARFVFRLKFNTANLEPSDLKR
jgi:hypothetical protein